MIARPNVAHILPALLLATPVAARQFGPQQVITSSTVNPFSVFAADLDGDGDQDVLSASTADDKVAWYENTDGLGSFGPQKSIATGISGAHSVHAADMDGDGDLDALSAAFTSDTVAWHENADGKGAFGSTLPIGTDSDGVRSIDTADVDGDGDRDVLAAAYYDDAIELYRNTDGQGTFGLAQNLTTTVDGPYALLAADLDGDGRDDVLTSTTHSDEIVWLENLSASFGSNVSALSLSAGGTQPFTLEAGGQHGNLDYLVLGTEAGTAPGTSIDGLVLPLNVDAYTLHTLLAPNMPPLAGSFATLDGAGKSTASFSIPPGFNPTLSGLTLHHAYVVIEHQPGLLQVVFTSEAAPLLLLP